MITIFFLIKALIVITVFIFINGIIIVSFLKAAKDKKVEIENNKEVDNNSKKYILYVLDSENVGSFQAFIQVTEELDIVRNASKKAIVSEEDKNKLMESIDSSLMDLQKMLLDSQTGAIPNPSLLTKTFLQAFTSKALEMRIFYEGLIGNIIVEDPMKEHETNILKIVPKDKNAK